jgi:hypothetical protein
MVQSPQHSDSALGGFDWLDKTASLRGWFADWLRGAWRQIYWESLHQLHTKEEWAAYGAMEDFTSDNPSVGGNSFVA